MTKEARGLGDVGKGPQAQECRWPPAARKVKEMDSPRDPPGGTSPADTLTLAQ